MTASGTWVTATGFETVDSSTRKVVPRPFPGLSAVNVPPCNLMMDRLIDLATAGILDLNVVQRSALAELGIEL